ncbi:MAG: iron-containing alcohol dehydrogenase, partial [Proteobacteria bacterium]|nr:iron-containing alcohol dehydrogenase [Pseudomonadota bacterium]
MNFAQLTANWNYPTSIRQGPGRISELPAICRQLGLKAPLLVTDPGLAAMPMLTSAIALCAENGLACGLYSEIASNPTAAHIAAGVAAFRGGEHDGIIAFGGGSALDAGKAIALMVGQDRPLWDFED